MNDDLEGRLLDIYELMRRAGRRFLAQRRGPPPAPVAPSGDPLPAVIDLVRADLAERERKGIRTYGTRLYPHNGRKSLKDAYEEVLDLAMYLRQYIYETEGK